MFPVETISAKMLDYYVDRRDALIIDLREREAYARFFLPVHSILKSCQNSEPHHIPDETFRFVPARLSGLPRTARCNYSLLIGTD